MTNLSWLTYVMIILASYRLTHLIVFDKITEFIRKPFIKQEKTVDQNGRAVQKKSLPPHSVISQCYWCAGVWCAILIGICYLVWPRYAHPVIFILSIAGAQAILETCVGVGTKIIDVLAAIKHKKS
ncbi:DUF1360 domain-containing protein [Bacillus velezensis]|uniref:DUF1360 domain-containing protein n=1 Tax=Bacillus velezensis TaxID=492670 RepID=UPI002242A043|nr:DUF1360 domain-containing protein [Bacillus velezensis]